MKSVLRRLLAPLRTHPSLSAAVLLTLLLAGPPAIRLGRAHYHVAAANRALDHLEFATALDHARAAVALRPDHAPTHLTALRAARRSGQWEEAQTHLNACQRDERLREEVTLEWALLRARRGEYPRVEDYLRGKLAEDGPQTLPILEVVTDELMRTRRVAEARAYLDRWLARWPSAEPLVRRAWLAERQVDDAAALRDYLDALALDPGREAVRLRVAELLNRAKRPAEALEHLALLTGASADGVEARLERARALAGLGKMDEARTQLDSLIAEKPNDARVLGERGRLDLDAGLLQEAEPFLRRAVAENPHEYEYSYNLVRCLQQLGKSKEAAPHLARLEQADADRRRVGTLMQLLQKRPRDADLRCEIGSIFLRNGLTDEGLSWLGMALEFEPGHRPSHEALAAHFEKVGETERAARHRKALAAP